MKEIRYTLLSEGPSDKALLPILDWLLRQHFSEYEIQREWADLAKLPVPPKSLSDRIDMSFRLYPCNILFVHRDADNQGWEKRVEEIDTAWGSITEKQKYAQVKLVHVIPIRMTEAWLLLDEAAIRWAAENPRGGRALDIPLAKTVENLADPKATLQALLRQASGASGRRLKRFNERTGDRMVRIAEEIQDFSLLRQLSAFQRLETCVQAIGQAL